MSKVNLINGDCMKFMRECSDNQFDLAVADPMYDLSEAELCPGSKITKHGVNREHIEQARKLSKLEIVGTDFYTELCRISKNQIIWGINYFSFSNKIKGRIVWDKQNDGSTFSNCELASSSFHDGTRIFRHLWNGFIQKDMKNKEKRIHAFQKPVPLYKWILERYAKEGDSIIDTHGGSMSSVVASIDMEYDITCIEQDEDCFNSAVVRIQDHVTQLDMFIPVPTITINGEQQ